MAIGQRQRGLRFCRRRISMGRENLGGVCATFRKGQEGPTSRPKMKNWKIGSDLVKGPQREKGL